MQIQLFRCFLFFRLIIISILMKWIRLNRCLNAYYALTPNQPESRKSEVPCSHFCLKLQSRGGFPSIFMQHKGTLFHVTACFDIYPFS